MSLLLGPMSKHLPGHKELTSHKEIIKCKDVDKIYIPLTMGTALLEKKVSEGDYVKVGTVVALRNDHFYVPVFSSVSGVVKGFEKRMTSSTKMAEHIVIENDFKYVVEDLTTLSEDASKEEVVNFIKEKGIVGCGGAGFPTYFKFVKTDGCQTLLINAVECEPYLTSDYLNMKENLEDMVLGIKTLFRISGASTCKLAIKKTKKEFIERIKELFKNETNIEVVGVSDVYPMGWERTLVYEVLKKRYDKLPIEAGCIVSNVTTAIKTAQAMRTGLPIVEKIVTVSGDGIKSPCNVLVRVGTPVSYLVELCQGYTTENIQLIAGGPMMGNAITNDNFVITASDNGLTVLKYQEVKSMACLRCGACVDHCPSAIMPVNINNAEKTKNVDRLLKLNVNACIECGMCTYVCPSKLDVTEGVRRAKRFLALKGKK